MKRRLVGVLFATVATFGCSNGTAPVNVSLLEGDDDALVISIDERAHDREFVSREGIRGTIVNRSDRPVYARLGDAMNAAVEHELLYVAQLSDGAVEREAAPGAWTQVPLQILIEGARFVMLRPGVSYAFVAPIEETAQSGTFRVAVSYRSTINDEEPAVTGTSHSPAFEVR